jgi:tRNA pseudouridine65 synthase
LLEIIYQDEYYVAINKPHGLLVHKSSIAKDVSVFALQLLRDQLNRHVYPVHRLDRKTSGVLLFALDEESLKKAQHLFVSKTVVKKYLSIVRGFAPAEGIIDYPLKKENGTVQAALTRYCTLKMGEINVPLGKHPTSRYSLVEVIPETGRMHQIRKHFAHILHPIIGDRPYGCNKQNRQFKQKWEMETMLLHARELKFVHPYSEKEIIIKATLHPEFERMQKFLNLSLD